MLNSFAKPKTSWFDSVGGMDRFLTAKCFAVVCSVLVDVPKSF